MASKCRFHWSTARALRRTGRGPLLLYGYGAYGHSIDPRFSSDRLSLLDRGFVFAIAHIRGGAELGEEWHDQGKLLAEEKHVYATSSPARNI